MRTLHIPLAVAALLCAAPGLHAEKKTVCTITVNSSDEKEAFRQNLPRDKYQFVELVEKGRPDWLRSSCQKGIQCDVLVVSGHFNAGETFYSDKVGNNDFLQVDELERAACSESCPGLFAHLKEVYLFGCESLNPDSTKYSSSYGESGRDRMRRLFANVPAIYGFYSSAPVGPTAAMLLGRYFQSPGGEIFTGHPSQRLLNAFSHNHMTVTSGAGASNAAFRHDVCQFYDERLGVARKLDFIHGILGREVADVRLFFERIEKSLASLTEEERQSPAFAQGVAEIARDRPARDRYLALARGVSQPTLRARMIGVARTLGWLGPEEYRAEVVRLVNDLLAGNSVGFAEVDLVCSLNADRALDGDLPRLQLPLAAAQKVSHAALLACMGSPEAHAQVLRALASADDRDVQVAQAYLRNRPVADPRELRDVTRVIAHMNGGGAQVRALDTLARLHIADREILEELARSFSAARSVSVQRAIAEVFIRSDPKALPRLQLAAVLREHRLKSPDGREDLIDLLIRRLQSS